MAKQRGGKKKSNSNKAENKPEDVADKMDQMTLEQKARKKGNEFKALGNAALIKGNNAEAIKHYTEGMEVDGKNHILYSNRSAAYLNEKDFENAVADAKKCIEINPTWTKGFSRLGSAYFFQEDYESSIETYKNGLKVNPICPILTEGLTSAQEGLRKNPKPIEHVIGIDLGTTYSCVSVFKDGAVQIIPDGEGNKTTPSIVGFAEDGERLIGNAARRAASQNPLNTIYDAKRILGQRMSDAQVKADVKRFPFKVSTGADDKPVIEITSNGGVVSKFAPEEISSMVLTKMKTIAEDYLGEPVKKAVVTVPAYFSDAQRQATKDAGMIAGLEVLRVINEPTAAALAYGLDMTQSDEAQKQKNILVFDLGGGTFDVSLLSIDGGIFEVIATAGDTHLGGEDFDDAVLDWVVDQFIKKNKSSGADPKTSPYSMKRLRVACEQAKRFLSSNETTTIIVDSLIDGIDFNLQVTRAKFDQLNAKFFKKTTETVTKVMKDAKMDIKQIDDIVLVGGSTRIPKVQEMLQALFKGKDLCKSINPDEAVAYGAAVQGAILSGARSDATNQLLLVDVCPLSLGIELTGRIFSPIIPRNTAVPVVRTKTYTTEEDWQTSIDVCVYEGERTSVDGNNLLGEFKIDGIERAKRGVPQVEVEFKIDTNGILNVVARDLVTKVEAKTTIAANRGRLSQDQIDRMLADAEKYAESDKLRVKQVEAKNELETLLYHMFDQARQKQNLSVLEKLETVQGWLEQNPNASLDELKNVQSDLQAYVK